MMSCCVCGNRACARVKKQNDDEDDNEDDEEMSLYYCKDHLRGRRADKSFFD